MVPVLLKIYGSCAFSHYFGLSAVGSQAHNSRGDGIAVASVYHHVYVHILEAQGYLFGHYDLILAQSVGRYRGGEKWRSKLVG